MLLHECLSSYFTGAPLASCKALLDEGYTTSGIYTINPNGRDFNVFCDMSLQGGGWTIIQRRVSNVTDFNRNWNEYKIGFGKYEGNFWLGLDKINMITDYETNKLYIGLASFDDTYRKAWYASFALDEINDYKLTLGAYDTTESDAGDAFDGHHNDKFSTKDKDNDESATHCAQTYESGWWYSSTCHDAHLNGVYVNDPGTGQTSGHGIIWQDWLGDTESLKTVVMAIRPA